MSRFATLRVWIGPLLRERARHEANWYLPHRHQRWAYTLKALVLILLNWDDEHGRGPAPWTPDDGIEVAHCCGGTTYSPEWGEGGHMDYLAVGPGLLRGWWYRWGEAAWP